MAIKVIMFSRNLFLIDMHIAYPAIQGSLFLKKVFLGIMKNRDPCTVGHSIICTPQF